MSSVSEDAGAAREVAPRLERWSGLAGFDAATPAWRELLRVAAIDPLCNDPAWVRDHVASYSDPATLFGWTATDATGEPVGVFAFRREPSRGPLRARRAILAQDGSFESDYVDFPVRPGAEQAVMSALVTALERESGVDAAVLHALDAESRSLAALRRVLEQRGTPTRESAVSCAVTELPASFEAFLAATKKRMRSKIRQALRRAAEAGATYRWIEGELEQELDGLFRLHQARWAAVGGTGSFADERRRAFYARFAPRHLASGTLRLARLDLDGRAVAYQIGLVAGERYYQLQEGYDPAYEELRVATALRAWALEQLIDSGIRHYDFMAGESRHKADWGGVERPCCLLTFPTSARGRLGFGARRWVESVRPTR
ncbi:MAG: GNAT family N-acetyltransferase [Planctomycetota bacterium]